MTRRTAVTHAANNRLKMAKSTERLPGTSTRLRTRDDGCCSVNFLKYVLHIYNVVLFVRTVYLSRARKKGIFYFGDTAVQERALTQMKDCEIRRPRFTREALLVLFALSEVTLIQVSFFQPFIVYSRLSVARCEITRRVEHRSVQFS